MIWKLVAHSQTVCGASGRGSGQMREQREERLVTCRWTKITLLPETSYFKIFIDHSGKICSFWRRRAHREIQRWRNVSIVAIFALSSRRRFGRAVVDVLHICFLTLLSPQQLIVSHKCSPRTLNLFISISDDQKGVHFE